MLRGSTEALGLICSSVVALCPSGGDILTVYSDSSLLRKAINHTLPLIPLLYIPYPVHS